MLSRIDDVASVEDIAIMVGLKLNELMSILDRLADLGAVELSWRTAKPPANQNAEPEAVSHKGESHPAVQRALAPPAVQPFTEGELEEPGDLTEAQKRRVLIAYYGIEGKNYYQLLGVDNNADKKTIRSAYFELSRLFHPDSMFGKDLGSFKAKMEAVFKRLTEAYEVLGRNQRRKEYDEYLASMVTTSVLQNRFDSVESQVRALSTAPPQHKRPHAPVAEAAPVVSSAASSGARSTHKSAPPQPAAAAVAPDPRRISQVGERPSTTTLEERKALARERLRRSFAGSASQVGSSSATVPNRSGQQSQPIATGSADRSRAPSVRQSSVGAGGIEAVLAHLRRAKDAEAAGDLLGAAAALQAALALQPEHKDLQAQYARVSSAVTRKLAENYEKQARYEEKQGKWGAAALSWERVSDGRPESADAARAVAEALLRASGDMHKAQRYATRAVDLAPQDSANVVVLARVLIAAGLRSQARRELEKAVKLDPQNAMIKDLLREVR